MAIVAIIPARFGSHRLPGKPLSDIQGRPNADAAPVAVARGRAREPVAVYGARSMAADTPKDSERVRVLLAAEKGRVA